MLSLLLNSDGLLLEQVDNYHQSALTQNVHDMRHTSLSNNLALFLWLCDSLETSKEKIGRIDDCEVDAKMLLQRLLYLLAFVKTHQTYQPSVSVLVKCENSHTVIDENSVETVA